MTDSISPGSTLPTVEPTAEVPRNRRWAKTIVICFVVGAVIGLVIGVSSRSDESSPTLSWTTIEGGLEEATLTVPVDHSDPSGDTLDLRIVRRPATDATARVGSLLVNPGGPGFGAESMVTGAADVFQKEILDRFDIVAMDPRGTGRSTPAIDCIDDYDRFNSALDISPQDDATRQAQIDAAVTYARGCVERTGDAIAHMTTAATARDLDLLRRALGEDTISYFGTSYGCTLGATWATLFPDTVRAAVLDGCEDPSANQFESARQQATGFQRSVEAFLDKCASAPSQCPIGKDRKPVDALRELWVRAANGDVAGAPRRPAVNESVLQTAIIVSMYSEDIWPTFAQAIASGLDGDGTLLMQLADAYNQRRPDGTWGNELEAFSVIGCMDEPSRPSLQEMESLSAELSSIAPLIYPKGYFTANICDAMPAPATPPVVITGSGAPTLLVIGNTGDPATPFASTRKMAAALETSVLVAVESNNHGGYGVNECVNGKVHRYLVDRVSPDTGSAC